MLRSVQSLREIALFEEALCQPQLRRGPIGSQLGRAVEGDCGEAGISVGEECATCSEEKGRFIDGTEVAEDFAPVIAPAEKVGVLLLHGSRIEARFFPALPTLIEFEVDMGGEVLGIEVEGTLERLTGFGP